MRLGLSMVVLLTLGCAQQDEKGRPQPSPPVAASASPPEATTDAEDERKRAPRVGGPDGRGYGGPRPSLPNVMPSAVEESALTLPNLQSCQSSCVDRNRARSVGADQIDAHCRAECKRDCLEHCKTASAATRAACTKDCERQAARVR